MAHKFSDQHILNPSGAKLLALGANGETGMVHERALRGIAALPRTYAKLFRMMHGYNEPTDRLNVLMLGDSTGGFVMANSQLLRALAGTAGVYVVGSLGSVTINGTSFYGADQSVTQNAGAYTIYSGYDCAISPTGSYILLDGSGDTVTFGLAGGNFRSVTGVSLKYIQEPGGGSFDVYVYSTQTSTWVKHNVDPVSSDGTGQIASYDIAGLSASYAYLFRVDFVSGTAKILNTNIVSSKAIVNVITSQRGGLQMTGEPTSGNGFMGSYADALSDMTSHVSGGIDLITYQDLGTYEQYADETYGFAALMQRLRDQFPSADILVVGPHPTSQMETQSDTVELMSRVCAAHNALFFDQTILLPSYTMIESLGWEGDGVHISADAYSYCAASLISWIGLADYPFGYLSKNVSGKIVSTQITSKYSDAVNTVMTHGSSDMGVAMNRCIVFSDKYGDAKFRIGNGLMPHQNYGQLEFKPYGGTVTPTTTGQAGRVWRNGSYLYFSPSDGVVVRIGASGIETTW